MKIGLLVVSVIGLSVTCTTWANDLPSLGYSPGLPVKDLVAKGYRWVTVNGPYACVTEQEVRQITSDHTDLRELHMVANLRAYYLIPGTLARIVQDDHANGMSAIRLAGITASCFRPRIGWGRRIPWWRLGAISADGMAVGATGMAVGATGMRVAMEAIGMGSLVRRTILVRMAVALLAVKLSWLLLWLLE